MRIDATRMRITSAPAEEPVTLAEAKLHLRIDHADEDALVDRLIVLARTQCEEIARRSLVTRTYAAALDDWPGDRSFEFPQPPLIGVTSVTYTDDVGVTRTLASSEYLVDTYREPGRLVLKTNANWPTVTLREINGVTVTWTAGYGGAEDVPARYIQAMLLLVSHLYENREAVLVAQGVSVMALPMGLDMLLLNDRGGW